MSDRTITGVLLIVAAGALFYGWVRGLFSAQFADVVAAFSGTPTPSSSGSSGGFGGGGSYGTPASSTPAARTRALPA